MSTRDAWRAYHRVGPSTFVRAVRAVPRLRGYLARHTVDEYARMACYLAGDTRSGYAINAGELVNLFSYGRPGDGELALTDAIARGAWRLDCFDGFLTRYYARHGFREVWREPWSDDLAPAEWHPADGRPDVVWMEWRVRGTRGV